MPIYEYKCKNCDNHFEIMQKISEDPLKECEKCGGELEKQWSLSGFQFKGGGWYVTDYAGNKSGQAPKVDVKPDESKVVTNLLKDEKKSSSDTTTPTKSDASNTTAKKE
jgi:putative FmdB family regulatory protein